MPVIHTEPYEHEGKTFEIRVYGSGWDFSVQAFLDGKRANGYSYSVSLPTAIDLNHIHRLDAVKILIDTAKRDIADKIWDKYVEAYVDGLKKTREGALGCRNCGKRRIATRIIDEREMYECAECGKVWYAPRVMTSPYLTVVDDITEGVERDDSYEIDTSILLNTAFRAYATGPSFEDQLQNWTLQNKLSYEPFRKNGRPHLRFVRTRN